MGQLISVIIPTLNEAARVEGCLVPLLGRPGVEVIVVDGNSHDGTSEIARRFGARVLSTAPGRALQMNLGSAKASGDILLFLHGDTRLPEDFSRQVRAVLGRRGVAAGAFRLGIAARGVAFRCVEIFANLRSTLLQTPYGDQAIFVARATFQRLGGFPEMPIMEDFEFIRRARRLGRIEITPSTAVTSARRWQRLGVVRTTLLNWWIVLAYYAGVPPERLRSWYRGQPDATDPRLQTSDS